jgi:hypothetical protein
VDPIQLRHIQQALLAQAAYCRELSPISAALGEGLGAAPGPALADLFDRYFRITSMLAPDSDLLLAGLHWLALRGDAPGLARFYPSCGGTYSPTDREALLAAAGEALAEGREELLEFMLSREPRTCEVRRSAAFLLGALATADRFPGGIAVVEAGAGEGLSLWFERYAYRFTPAVDLGESPLRLDVALTDKGGAASRLLSQGMPQVVARYGLDQEPKDLAAPEERLALEAFFRPEQADAVERLRTAAGLVEGFGPSLIREGQVEWHLSALLVEAYNAMPPGNTLFLCHTLLWPSLTEDQRVRMTSAVQQLAAQLQPYKPIAWLQAEPFAPGSDRLELRLQTFGWADREDRAVRKLAEATPDLSQVRWLE